MGVFHVIKAEGITWLGYVINLSIWSNFVFTQIYKRKIEFHQT